MVRCDLAAQAVGAVASDHPFHPVRDYLGSLTWDAKERPVDWLETYLGAEATASSFAVGPKILVSAVARMMKPGAKVDTCAILEGPQGTLKSTALRKLCGDEFFSELSGNLASKDTLLQTTANGSSS